MYEQEIKDLGMQLARTPLSERASLTYRAEEPCDAGDYTILRCRRLLTFAESALMARVVEVGSWSGEHKRRMDEEELKALKQGYIEGKARHYAAKGALMGLAIATDEAHEETELRAEIERRALEIAATL